ncbi:hypothetical protein SpiGrapes_0330 [Sphaerochaeta pleomorpha str. Grapes]|uniref:Uncharacterized protein n=1 Tax=Sphaerochaeta pleomorpha (strain ATCC BAA-1885 / DSM 22778 / Grapes) TaxID=158190 RepID=G8QVF5_SPHPG|nr:hypothetical protein [Sphaerochaeta pleomorpha]AEV28188.1 hypothetical protein SpiGrapes_0330 [Sphaerochaeta pleomorpha str. Grapes]
MKKAFALFFLVIFLASSMPAFSEALPTYVPYEKNEFPLWTYKVRRAESLFFGSMALTLPVAILAYNVAVNYLSVPAASSQINTFLIQLGVASTLSAGISLADYIIGETRGL